jgi:peptide/nickel transport system permease protein
VIGYIIRRIGTSIVVLILVSIFIFGLLHVIYPTPAIDVLGPKANVATIAAWNKANGFDNPWFVQYLDYMGRLLRWNLGYSYKLNQPVTSMFGEVWQHSAFLSGASLILAVIIAVPLGVYQAVKRNTVGDYTATSLTFVLYAMPSFLLGLILIQVFALDLHWFNPYYEGASNASVFALFVDFRDMTLPVLTLTLVSVAAYSRYMRSTAMDTLAQDYIQVARAKGLPERLVLSRHLLRNASLPMVTLIGLSIPFLLAGNLITETLFNYRGLGLLFYNALNDVDYNVLLAYTLVGALLTIIGNLVADIALTVADPRIRLA